MPMTDGSSPSLWQRLVERRGIVRHPVSSTRQRLGAALLILLAIGFGYYAVSTRDEAIQQRVVAFLREVTSGDVSVSRAEFQMFGGITLYDVRVATPFDLRLDAKAVSEEDREIFSARTLRIVHNPWRLFFGALRVEQIIVTQPTITLVHNVDTGMRNWQLLAGPPRAPSARKSPHRPRICIRSAKAAVVSVHSDGRRESRVESLDADVRPHPATDTGYCIEVRRFTEPAERTTVIFDPGAKRVANTPFVDAQTVRLQLPKPAQQFFDEIALEGEVKLTRLVYDAAAPQERDTEIQLRRVRCSIPLSILRSGGQKGASRPAPSPDSADSVIAMIGVTGTLNLVGGRLDLDVSGLVNGAKCTVKGRLDGVDRSLDQVGIDVDIQGARVPAPEGALRAQILGDPIVPQNLKNFFADYDPHGLFDVALRIARPPGPGERLDLLGTLRPQGASGKDSNFPYIVENLVGQVRLESERVYIEDLKGRHGGAEIQINGVIDRHTARSEVNLDIQGSSVPLDDDLFMALSEHQQSIWRRFNPQGTARVTVKMHRPPATDADPPQKWETHVSADLIDSRILIEQFPYQLEGVQGRVELDEDRIRFVKLTGRHGEAEVGFDGDVSFEATDSPRWVLHVEAQSMMLDDQLAAAMPAEGRAAFAQFQPAGLVDLAGTVSLPGGSKDVQYDIQADLRGASMRYQGFPYRLDDLAGRINLRPESITFMHVIGRHGTASISADGRVRRESSGYSSDMSLACDQFPIDRDLRDALPESFKSLWATLSPAGSLSFRSALHLVSENDRRWQRHRTTLSVSDAQVCLRWFPLPLTGVSASINVTDRGMEILDLTGQTPCGRIALSGAIDLSDSAPRDTFSLHFRDMRIDESLLAVLPESIRGPVASLKPGGRFNLDLDPLQIEQDSEGRTRWSFSGEARLVDVHADLGFSLANVTGIVRGHGTVSPEGAVDLDARADLDSAELAGWRFEKVSSRIAVQSDASTILIKDTSAAAYDGQAAGFAEVKLGRAHADYHVSILLRDVQLARYLESIGAPARPRRNAAGTASGSIYGNIVLQGRTGPHGYREGAGELNVRQAQVWKLPLMLAIFQVLNLTPDENVFHDGWLKFFLSQDTLTFERIDLQGKALSFVGGGRMQLPGQDLDITLLAGSPLRLRVPLLTWLLEGATRELMEVRVTGTVQRPTITPSTLHGLAQAMKAAFPEPPRRVSERPIARPSR